ncbi:MAG: hypothetical protein ACRC1P_07455 [Cellulosilyticaceae bacterium]
MKKMIVSCLLALIAVSAFISLRKSTPLKLNTVISEQVTLNEVYWNAYLNCITYIETSSNSNRDINTSIVSVEILPANQKELVRLLNVEDYNHFSDTASEYWLFTIGDTKEHNYISIVCDSQSDSVIGSIPSK